MLTRGFGRVKTPPLLYVKALLVPEQAVVGCEPNRRHHSHLSVTPSGDSSEPPPPAAFGT